MVGVINRQFTPKLPLLLEFKLFCRMNGVEKGLFAHQTMHGYKVKHPRIKLDHLNPNGGFTWWQTTWTSRSHAASRLREEVNRSHSAVPQGSRKPKTSSSFLKTLLSFFFEGWVSRRASLTLLTTRRIQTGLNYQVLLVSFVSLASDPAHRIILLVNYASCWAISLCLPLMPIIW